MMTAARDALRNVYPTHDRDAMREWWREVTDRALSTVTLQGGTRVYVSDPLEEIERAPKVAFLRVHVVSIAVASQFETERWINEPSIVRLFPIDKIENIAPVVDA